MNNTETYVFKQNRFKRHSVDFFADEKETEINEAPSRVTDFDKITKRISINCLNVFIATEGKQVCSMLFQTKEKGRVSEKMLFFVPLIV